jgi:hypothetical protein
MERSAESGKYLVVWEVSVSWIYMDGVLKEGLKKRKRSNSSNSSEWGKGM